MPTPESDALWAHVAQEVLAKLPSGVPYTFAERKAIALDYASTQYDQVRAGWIKYGGPKWAKRLDAAANAWDEAEAWDHQCYCIMQGFDDPRGDHDAWANARLAEYKAAALVDKPRMCVRMVADGLYYKLSLDEQRDRTLWGLYSNGFYDMRPVQGMDTGYAMPATSHTYVTLSSNIDFQVRDDFTFSKWPGIAEVLRQTRMPCEMFGATYLVKEEINDDTYVREPVDNNMFVMPSDVGAALRSESPIGLGGAQSGWGGYED